jgi:hypothetical protein
MSTPNISHPPADCSANESAVISAVAWVMAAAAIKVVCTRFAVQRYIVGRLAASDWVMLLALVCVDIVGVVI